MWRKLILFGCFVLMLGLVGSSTALGTTLVIPLAAESDDAEELILDGSIPLDSGDLEIPYDGDPAPAALQIVGLRFADVQIAKGEIVKRAYVRFHADDVDNTRHEGEVHLLIEGQLDPNAATFEATALNVSARPRTAAVVEWNASRWLNTANKYWTSDVSSVIQEIVNQEGWAAGNALVLIISDNASNPSVGMREAESFGGAGTNAGRKPTLYIELGDIAAADEVYREAESADVLGASWRNYDSPASLGGKHIGSQNGDGDDNNTAPGAAWVAAYNFEATGGFYKVALRGQKNDSDSFWVRIIGAASQTYEHPAQAGTGWVRFNGFDVPGNAMGWDVVHSDDNNKDDVYWELPPGAHTLEIAKREDGTLLDSIIITNDVALDLAALPGPGASGLDMRIASASDSAEQHLDDNEMEVSSSDLEIPYETGGTPPTEEQVIGLRFAGALINQGAGVGGAYVEFEMDSVSKAGSNEPVNVVIEGELTPNAAAFAEVAGDITARPTTAAKVKWSLPTGLAVNDEFRSPDISRIIREIVGQDGWGPGNALVLIIRDDKDNPSTGLRETESFEGEAGAAPLLHLATIVPLAKDPNPANGAVGAAFAPPVGTYFSSDVPKAVPDRTYISHDVVLGEAASTLSVPDLFKVKDLNLELDITVSGNNSDLNVYIKDPGGKQVTMFEDIGLGKSGFRNVVLDDEASKSITSTPQPASYTGQFKPASSLSGFDGRDAQGTWQLRIVDDWYAGSATLNSWRLVILKPLLISWTPPGGAASQKLYFADNFEDVNNSAASASKGNLASSVSSYDVGTLALGQTYYWRVDGIAADGAVQSTGNIWSFTTAVGNVVASATPVASSDDAEEHGPWDNGKMESLTSSDLELPYDGDPVNGALQIVGVRFAGVAIPKGSTITRAAVQFSADDIDNSYHQGDVHLLIEGQLSPDPLTFVNEANNITARPKTTAVVPWSPARWMTVHLQGADERTSDISAIVQEIINQGDWASGNSMVLMFSDDPCNPSVAIREPESWDGASSNVVQRPTLHIGATTEAASTPTPANGAVNVPLDTVLSWEPGLNAVWRTVYFGKTSSPASVGMTTGRSSAPKLDPSTTYYWKVEEVEANGTKHAGPVWSFTTVPAEATVPSPADGAKDVASDVILSWKAGVRAVSHDVYFGMSSPPPFIGNQAESSYSPGGIRLTGTFYWRIDEIDADGTKHVGAVWSFSTASGQASQPDPAEGTVLEQKFALLGWAAGPTAVSHNVYISNSLDDVTSGAAAAFAGNYTTTNLSVGLPGVPVPDGLVPGSTYYWRVDEVEADPTVVHEGAVWSFSVLRDKAHNPNPADGATGVATNKQLSWTAGLAAKLHSVYFGDNLDTVTNAVGAPPLPLTTKNPGPLLPGTTYYWRVDEFNPPTIVKGDVWSFTTAP
jgi:subtilisin-like proprotein convertase family protein